METAYSQALHRENTSPLSHPPTSKASGSPVPGKEQLKKGTGVEPRAVAQSSTKRLGDGWQGSSDHHHPLSCFCSLGSAALFPPRPALGEMLCPFPPIPLVADPCPSLEVVESAPFPQPQKPGSPPAALPKQAAEAGKGMQGVSAVPLTLCHSPSASLGPHLKNQGSRRRMGLEVTSWNAGS